MEGEEEKLLSILEEKFFHIFSDFMSRIMKFEELVTGGSELLVGFQQGLDLLQRPPINKTSELVESIIKANETKRVKAYIEAGCISVRDGVQNLSKSKCVLSELECLMEDVGGVIQTAPESVSYFGNFSVDELEHQTTNCEKEKMESCKHQKPVVTDYAAMMGIVYSMVKEDYMMQEKIISSLNLNSPSGELESYCMMWSLRPFINDETMHRAWKLIP